MKIKKEQLKTIQEQQKELNDILNQVGYLEAQKHGLLHKFGEINVEVEKTKKELESEYGSVNINVETGEYTKIEEDSKLKVVEDVK
jgi:hypothetical protein